MEYALVDTRIIWGSSAVTKLRSELRKISSQVVDLSLVSNRWLKDYQKTSIIEDLTDSSRIKDGKPKMTTDIEYEILQLTRKAMVKAKESPGNQATLKKVLEDYLDDKNSALTNHLEPVASQNNVHIISDSEDENEKEEEDDEDLLTSQSTQNLNTVQIQIQDPLRMKQKGRPKIRTNRSPKKVKLFHSQSQSSQQSNQSRAQLSQSPQQSQPCQQSGHQFTQHSVPTYLSIPRHNLNNSNTSTQSTKQSQQQAVNQRQENLPVLTCQDLLEFKDKELAKFIKIKKEQLPITVPGSILLHYGTASNNFQVKIVPPESELIEAELALRNPQHQGEYCSFQQQKI